MNGADSPGPSAAPGADPAGPPGAASAGGPEESGLLHDWATGGALFAACADLLVAILCGLAEPLADPTLFSTRGLAPWVGAAAFASLAFAAVAWRWGPRGLWAAALFHGLAASAGWLLVPGRLGGIPRPVLAALVVHGLCGAAALAGAVAAASAAPRTLGRMTRGSARAAAENLESVLVAIVFALVIRHFAVEAYKIPTESMSPTLLGDDSRRGPGDRVLVEKWPALLGGPHRWEIWVFRPPRERTINYVKRVVGLPGEDVEIRDGDLYVDGQIARKPPKTREEMWFPVWPRDDGKEEKKPPWLGEGFRKDGPDGFAVSGAKERRLLRYEPAIRDAVYGKSGSIEVGDLRLRFEVEDAEPGTEFVVRLAGRAGPIEVRVDAEGRNVRWTAGASTVGDAGLSAGPVRGLEVSFADLALEVLVNGKAFRAVNLDPAPSEGDRPPYGVSFGVDRGGAVFRNVRLDRDVFYTNTGTTKFHVPEGHYLFLGDNSSSSMDARSWYGWEIREKGAGGRVFFASDRPSPLDRGGRLEFTDRNGVFRSYGPGELEFSEGMVPMSFVPREDLHGRAFAVFWPPRWFTKMEGGRVRFLP